MPLLILLNLKLPLREACSLLPQPVLEVGRLDLVLLDRLPSYEAATTQLVAVLPPAVAK